MTEDSDWGDGEGRPLSGDTFEKISVLVDLDSILDTRAALLHSLNPEKFVHLLTTRYHDRESDDFEGFDFEEFRSLYLKRDKKLLRNSVVTPVMQLVNRFIKQTHVAAMESPIVRAPKVDINIYPYVLTDSEKAVIVQAVVSRSEGKTDVEIVSYSPEELTPSLVLSKYVEVIMYHWLDWLVHPAHTKEFLTGKLKSVFLYGPYLLKNRAAEKELEGLMPMENAETYYGQFVRLVLLGASIFSFDSKRIMGQKKE